MVRFAEPAYLWLLLLPGAGVALAWLRHRQRRLATQRLASPSVWRQVMGGLPATGLWRMVAWCAAAACVVLALARPQWGELPRKVSIRTRDVVLAVDVSDSMRCQDVRPSRLGHGLELLRRALPGLDGNRVGVVTFAGDAYPLVPLTTDLDAVGTFLEGVEPGAIALPGSNISRAVDAGLELLPEEGTGRVLVLVTDGENLQGNLQAAADRLKKAGVRAIGIVVGTADGGPIPVVDRDGKVHYKRDRGGRVVVTHARRSTLARLAAATGGSVVSSTSPGAPEELARRMAELQSRAVGTSREVRRVDRFPLFLIAAAVFLTLGFALSPWRKLAVAALAVLVLAAPPALAQQAPPAGTPVAASAAGAHLPWWQRWIPGGSRRLARTGLGRWRAHKVRPAAKAFAGAAALDPQNPARSYDLGTALAAQGDLKEAAPLLEAARRAGMSAATYNLGTTALEKRQAKPAVTYLREALLARPDDPKVKRNYELALKLLEEQRKQKEQKKQNRDDQGKRGKEQEKGKQDGGRQKPSPQKAANRPTPTPTPGAQPRPQPQRRRPGNPLFGALERAEAQARANMKRPTPRAVVVEKDW